MRRLVTLLVAAAVVIAAAGCSDDGSGADDAGDIEATATDAEDQPTGDEVEDDVPEVDCVVVPASSGNELPELRAVRLDQPNDFGEASSLWVVSSAAGATWLMRGDEAMPTTGPILPLNDEARNASISGVDVPEDAPVFQDVTGDDPAVAASQACWDEN